MNYGIFNYFHIKFSLEAEKSTEGKVQYLLELKEKISHIIKCFEEGKLLPLYNFTNDSILTTFSCPELIQFIRTQLKKYSMFGNDPRVPGNEFLLKLVDQEIQVYQSLEAIIDIELEELVKNTGWNNFFWQVKKIYHNQSNHLQA